MKPAPRPASERIEAAKRHVVVLRELIDGVLAAQYHSDAGPGSAAMAGGTTSRNPARRSAEQLCGAVGVVMTLTPRRLSCAGTQTRSAVPGPDFGSCSTTV